MLYDFTHTHTQCERENVTPRYYYNPLKWINKLKVINMF